MYCESDWMDSDAFAKLCLDAEAASLRSIRTASALRPKSRKLMQAKHMGLIEGREEHSISEIDLSGAPGPKPWTALRRLLDQQ